MGEIPPELNPALDIPTAETTCRVEMIDTTCVLTVPGDTLVEPTIPGHELMNFPVVSFLITHESTGRQMLFDLGCRKDFWNLPSPIADTIESKVPGIKVDKNLVDILVQGGVEVGNIEAAIISHHHYDHIGDPGTFPKSMSLIVGPGFSENFPPGYPTKEEAPVFESAFEGRRVREVDFSGSLMVAGYKASDYFGDGSLYILNTPGHAIGHISSLVRTTRNTYVFLGGDICHFGGAFRPTQWLPMPSQLEADEIGPYEGRLEAMPSSLFMACHPCGGRSSTTPFYRPCSGEDSWYVDPAQAWHSVDLLKRLDANEQVLVLIAHDPAMMDVLPCFPGGSSNRWYEAGWKRMIRWRFLTELPVNGNSAPHLVDGTYRNGKLVKTLDGVLMGAAKG
jgi:glyoxylase-like metal-dependent hydrolase (beta-lactamase superfamily II)